MADMYYDDMFIIMYLCMLDYARNHHSRIDIYLDFDSSPGVAYNTVPFSLAVSTWVCMVVVKLGISSTISLILFKFIYTCFSFHISSLVHC